jgi:hypothetical protein
MSQTLQPYQQRSPETLINLCTLSPQIGNTVLFFKRNGSTGLKWSLFGGDISYKSADKFIRVSSDL